MEKAKNTDKIVWRNLSDLSIFLTEKFMIDHTISEENISEIVRPMRNMDLNDMEKYAGEVLEILETKEVNKALMEIKEMQKNL